MKRLRIFVVLFVPVIITSCGVYMTQPFPVNDPPVDKERLEGRWRGDDNIYELQFGTNGIGYCGTLKWEDEEFKAESVRFFTATGLVNNYIALECIDENKLNPTLYLLYRYSFISDNELVLWEPDLKLFDKAIKAGAFAGKVKYKTQKVVTPEDVPETIQRTPEPTYVILSTLPLDVIKFLDEPANVGYFMTNEASVLRKITGDIAEKMPARL